MGKIFQNWLNGTSVYRCATCHCHLANQEEIISKQFQGRHGRAYLFANVVNISLGAREDRVLITGLHTVCDILCNCCQTVLGWKYEVAYEEGQKYKEGKYIMEKEKIEKISQSDPPESAEELDF
eukprot:EG_transcript_23018